MLFILPFIVSDRFAFGFRFIERLNTESEAYPVGNFFYFIERFLVGIELLAVNAVGVYDDMVVQMTFINVSCDYDLTIIAERFSSEGSANLVCEFR